MLFSIYYLPLVYNHICLNTPATHFSTFQFTTLVTCIGMGNFLPHDCFFTYSHPDPPLVGVIDIVQVFALFSTPCNKIKSNLYAK